MFVPFFLTQMQAEKGCEGLGHILRRFFNRERELFLKGFCDVEEPKLTVGVQGEKAKLQIDQSI